MGQTSILLGLECHVRHMRNGNVCDGIFFLFICYFVGQFGVLFHSTLYLLQITRTCVTTQYTVEQNSNGYVSGHVICFPFLTRASLSPTLNRFHCTCPYQLSFPSPSIEFQKLPFRQICRFPQTLTLIQVITPLV